MSNRSIASHLALAAALSACGDAGSSVDSTAPAAMNSAYSGGASGSEAAPSSNGAGAAGAGSAANDEDYGNAFASGSWRGYFWTSVQGPGTVISPHDFSAQTSGMPRCVKGSVGVTSDNSGLAILGANLKEDATGKMSVTPTKKGVTVYVMNNTSAPIMFQIQGPAGQWCTYLNAGGGFMPWEKLNTACWNDSGNAYNHEPITAAALVVPGNSSAPVEFDFCLLHLEEADGW